jgi:hypothetical protein
MVLPFERRFAYPAGPGRVVTGGLSGRIGRASPGLPHGNGREPDIIQANHDEPKRLRIDYKRALHRTQVRTPMLIRNS